MSFRVKQVYSCAKKYSPVNKASKPLHPLKMGSERERPIYR